MEPKELLLHVLTKQFNKTEDEVKKAIFDESGETLLDTASETIGTMDAARVAKFRNDGTAAFKNGYAKAKEEERKAAAKLVKETFEIESDTDELDEILEKGKEQIAEKTKQKVQLPTEEAVKKEPWFIKFEKDRVLKSELDKSVNEFNQFKQGIEEEKSFSTIQERAMNSLKKLNPNFDMYKDVPEILNNLLNSFIGKLKEYKYQMNGDDILILKPDGTRLDNPAGWPETLDSIVEQKSKGYFTFLKQKPRGAPGNEGTPTPPETPPSGAPEFKTKAEYLTFMKGCDDSPEGEKRMVEGMNKFKELTKAGAIAE